MKKLGRIGFVNRSLRRFLTNLKRHHRGDFDALAKEPTEKYLPKKGEKGCFSQVKPSESEKTLKIVNADLHELVQRFGNREDIRSMRSCRLLERVLEEQCIVETSPDEDGEKVSVRPAKEISSSSLQNSSDPDAAFSGHKGQGYQVQVMETFCDEEDKKTRGQTLNLITYVEAEPADSSDGAALGRAISSVKERNLLPEEVTADALYGSQDNVEKAVEEGGKLIAPTMGTAEKSSLAPADFEFSDSCEVCRCPQSQPPAFVKKSKKKIFSGAFDYSVCGGCPREEDCPVKKRKKYHYLRQNEKSFHISQRRAEEQSKKFKERYRWRAGVKAAMSECDSRTGVKLLRVRGLRNVQYCARLKAVGVNIFRATAVRNARKRGKSCFDWPSAPFFMVFLTVKGQIWAECDILNFLSHNHVDDYESGYRMAA